MNLYIGTCGFAYPDWDGPFYPPNLPVRDRLAYYAERFRAVEIDSSFYHIPSADTLEKMARRTRKDFRFTVKAHRSMTHEFDPALADFAGFREALAPLVESDRLGAVLAQFPPAFRCTRDSVGMLRTIREELADLPLAAEFRHDSWNRPETFEFLRKHQIAWCAVDEPGIAGLLPAVAEVTAPFAYVRFHGRNTAKWQAGRSAAERHDYLYTAEQLEGWADRIHEMAARTDAVYVMFSNVHAAQGVANARQLAARLGVPLAPMTRRRRRSEAGQAELPLDWTPSAADAA